MTTVHSPAIPGPARQGPARQGPARQGPALAGHGVTTGNGVTAGTGQAAGQVAVTYLDGDSYSIVTRGHTVLVDQPIDAGGTDTAPTPTELFVASLASCVAFYAGRFLVRHGLERAGLTVSAEFTMASDRPARVGSVRLRLTVPGGVPAERRDALIAVASHCTVHNTLRSQPAVAIDLA